MAFLLSAWVPSSNASKPDYTHPWIDPSGELSVGEFVLAHAGDVSLGRQKFRALGIQLLLCVVIFSLFAQCTIRAGVLLTYSHGRSISVWCCCIQALTGCITALVFLAGSLPNGPSCRVDVWTATIGLTVSSLCIHVVLLEKAYVVCNRDRRLLVIAVLLLLPSVALIYSGIWISYAQVDEQGFCLKIYAPMHPWIKFWLDASVNMVFSSIFLSVILQQYRQFGTRAWGRLSRDGILIMLGIILSNTLAALGASLHLLGPLSQWLYLVDWAVTSILLIHQLAYMRATLRKRAKAELPKHSQPAINRDRQRLPS
ncbi:hypothetical protein THASP1DRAFT_32978 [Thamnocephalis sphaerospora]|uniref:Uncharacterized protein n=1 Tax=Thamnocephalis sphaerospora TaxID=78915 RepID=A0A4P9XHL9_9FUNG|nr:hypothetical protein THASP1DRAFT_32978 [Thamnocephalis sphaerospora]|eukprot:RKP05183.1 hypothetical protein THASP1DRAFT_32978 [Thamnocephalis sphaerospora]